MTRAVAPKGRRRTLATIAVMWFGLVACGAGSRSVDYRAVEMTSGGEVTLATLAGRPVVLTSWATWCAECDELLSGLQAFAESPAAAGVEIVAVNLDAADNTAEIDAKITDHELSTVLWRDRRNEFRAAFGALGVPTSVVLDRRGEVVATFPGAVDFAGDDFTRALDTARGADGA